MQALTSYLKNIITLVLLLIICEKGFSQKLADNEAKKNITVINNPLESLSQLEPRAFEYDKDKYKELRLPEGQRYGFSAENMMTVFPSLVKYENYSYAVGKNNYRQTRVKTIDMEGLIPVLVASIRELQLEVERLKEEVRELKK